MNNTFERVINLKQETHTIHFQIEDNNKESKATLRGSSIKPALDRYMFSFLSKQKNDNGEALDFSEWILKDVETKDDNESCKAFNYKMFIDGTLDTNVKTCNLPYLMFYNRPPKNNKEFHSRNGWFFKDVKISIRSFVEKKLFINLDGEYKEYSILDFIEKFIVEFFKIYNYGFRQSRGFGSFVVDGAPVEDNSQELENNIKKYFGNQYDVIVIDNHSNYSVDYFYDDIEQIIKSLRRDDNLRLAYPIEYLNLCDVEKTKNENKNIKDIRKRTVRLENGKTINAKTYNDEIKLLFGSSSISEYISKKLDKEIKANEARYPSAIAFKKYYQYLVITINKEYIEKFPDEFVLKALRRKGDGNAFIGYKRMIISVLEKLDFIEN